MSCICSLLVVHLGFSGAHLRGGEIMYRDLGTFDPFAVNCLPVNAGGKTVKMSSLISNVSARCAQVQE